MEYGSFQAEEFGDLQRLVDGLFYDRHAIDRLDLIVQAEILDLAPDLMEIELVVFNGHKHVALVDGLACLHVDRIDRAVDRRGDH